MNNDIRHEKNYLEASFSCLCEEVCVCGSDPEFRKLAREILAVESGDDDDTSLYVAPEDIVTLALNKWDANFTLNASEKKYLINDAPVVFKLINTLGSNKYTGEDGNTRTILYQNRNLMNYSCERGGFPKHLSHV